MDAMTEEPLEQWRREQPAQQEAVLSAVLREGQRYRVDNGVFRARRDADGRWTLWKSEEGKGGNDVGTRNGFEIGEFGGLYDRVWDLDAQEAMVVTGLPRYTVRDLVPVTREEAKEVDSMMAGNEFAEHYPAHYDAVQDEIERGNTARGRS